MEHTIRTNSLKQQLEKATGNNYACCYQCGKCTAGCPAGGFMDNPPARIMRLVQAGYVEEAMRSDSLWYCIGCMTCTTRCPQNMEIAGTMDALRENALKSGIVSSDKAKKLVTAFHTSFLNTVRKSGRLQELALVNSYKLRTRTFLQDAGAGLKMMKQGKINPVTAITAKETVEHKEQIEKIFRIAEEENHTAAPKRKPVKRTFRPDEPVRITHGMTIGYYPGCSLKQSSALYDHQSRRVFAEIGVDLVELADWNCCGATSAGKVDDFLAVAMPARNIGIAEAAGFTEVVIPCSACYSRTLVAQQRMKDNPPLKAEINAELLRKVRGGLKVSSILEVLIDRINSGALKEKVRHTFRRLKPVCYYGCMQTRFPYDVQVPDNVENPMGMETVLEAVGVKAIDWNHKTSCCGASAAVNDPETSMTLMGRIMAEALERGANCFVATCPMCQLNLDAHQDTFCKAIGADERLPVFFITEVIGAAMGISPEALQVDRHFVDGTTLLKELETDEQK